MLACRSMKLARAFVLSGVSIVVATAAPATVGATVDGTPVSPSAASQVQLATAADGAGGILVAWESIDGSAVTTKLSRLGADLSTTSAWPVTLRGKDAVTLTPDGTGGAYVATVIPGPDVLAFRVTAD